VFKFKAKASVEREFRDIALSQIDLVLTGAPSDTGAAIHEARRRGKKLRALFRLCRAAFDEWSDADKQIRKAASGLSGARDAQALVGTFDTYISPAAADADSLVPVRQAFVDRAAAFDTESGATLLAAFRETLAEVRARAENWSLSETGFDALRGGFGRTYRSARRLLRSARRSRRPVVLHEWRKAVKAHGLHVALLRATAPDVLKSEAEAWDRLAETLGDHHNLFVLRTSLSEGSEPLGPPDLVAEVDGIAAAQMSGLEDTAFHLGRQLLAERTSALKARYAHYWDG